jgi:hypothetical protein
MAVHQEIVEDTPITLVEDQNGFTTGRVFTVVARSQLAAREVLINNGVKIDAVWQSPHGESPEPNTLCRSIEIQPRIEAKIGGPDGLYDCIATYSQEDNTTDGGGVEPTPGGDPVYSIESSVVTTPADIDAAGDPIANSADEPFDPPLTLQTPREILVVQWFVPGVALISYLATTRKFLGSLNSNEFHGAPRGSMLCLGVKPVQQDANQLLVTARFEYQNPLDISLLPAVVKIKNTSGIWVTAADSQIEGWMSTAVDRGLRVKDGVDGSNKPKYKPIVNKDGQPITKPVDLDGDGNELTDGGTRVVRAYAMYKRFENFSSLAI